MARNLKAEMVRYGVRNEDIRQTIRKTDRCVRDKISGRAEFTLSEATKIRDAFFNGLTLEYLFAMTDTEHTDSA